MALSKIFNVLGVPSNFEIGESFLQWLETLGETGKVLPILLAFLFTMAPATSEPDDHYST